jgi:PEP-CTERM motif
MNHNLDRVLRLGWTLGLALTMTMGVARASTIIDQSDTFPFPSFLNIQLFSPIGQSFTPTLDSLNFVQIFSDSFGGGFPATLQTTVFSGILFGSPLGTSEPLTLPAGFEGSSTFFFPSSVALTPGDLYSFEVSVLSGATWGLGESGVGNYSGGTAIISGVPVTAPPGDDFWFVEGIETKATPEPSSLILLASGLAFLGAGHVRRRKKIHQ